MEILEIALIGAGLSGVVQFLKVKLKLEAWQTKGVVVGLSIVLGSLIYFIQDTSIWTSMLGILSIASAFWAFILKK